jgi:hypothetical protein
MRVRIGRPDRKRATLLLLAVAAALALGLRADGAVTASLAGCSTNEIACENEKPGSPRSEWDIVGSGDPSLQGFAAPFSLDQGGTVRFKVSTTAAAYRIDLYRLGWYGGLGARKVATLSPSAALPQTQPACVSQPSTGLVDCGNWADSATWSVPADAVSGVYVAKLVRPDTGGENHIVFVVRDDDGASDLLFQTSDTTWQAYNRYGGNSLYFGSPAGRAYKVSYNRPFTTRGYVVPSWLFSSEYPMIRWLERNGYDVSYFTGMDSARYGSELLEHSAFLSVGHDEYWSAGQRANVEAARDAGVDLGFFSGNEVFWKTRWEPSIDGAGTPFTTLVSYKETKAAAKIDPDPAWTGTWRDGRFSPPADGGRPENQLTGTTFSVNAYREDAIAVPAKFGAMRFWRNTSVASLPAGGTAVLPAGTLGHEWDEDRDNGFRPAGLLRLSSTSLTVAQKLQDEGNVYAQGNATHSLMLYRAPSGALVFGAGTVQWPWGLDAEHDVTNATPPRPPDARMQQATVNLFGDMGVQPTTLQSGIVPAAPSADSAPPSSTIAAPANGVVFQSGAAVTISGTAADTGGGVVAGVEVTTDGGETWHPAVGTTSWSYTWVAGGEADARIQSRAVDDSGNLETPAPGVLVEVACPCRIWSSAVIPTTRASSDTSPIEVGVKFTAEVDGWVTALRFYKGSGNAGTHVGSLWTSSGTLLARATFTGESASGWQEAQLDRPVAVTAGTTYVASYHAPVGRYALDLFEFSSTGIDHSPLHVPASSPAGGNGVFTYGDDSVFPTSSFAASNYWVDVVFHDQTPRDVKRPAVVAIAPARNATNGDAFGTVEATFSEALEPSTVSTTTVQLRDAAGVLVPATVAWNAVERKIVLAPASPLAYDAVYTARIAGGTPGVKDLSGNGLAADYTWAFRTAPLRACPCTIWSSSAVPAVRASTDAQATEVGLKFRADVAGWISGIRFYKGSGNGGAHTGSLWTAGGTLLARVAFTGETATGWQQASFDGPVAVAAGTTYVVSYHAPLGRYAVNANAFGTTGTVNPPLRALRDGLDGGNGVYLYTSSPSFPTESYGASNYWVDVIFSSTPPADTVAPKVTARTPAPGSTGVDPGAQPTASFSEQIDPASLAAGFELRRPDGTPVEAAASYDAATRTATLRPLASLELGATYTAVLEGGSGGVRDPAGNGLAADVSWPFTVKACPCTIWGPAEQPAIPSTSDGGAVELGVRFRADRDGWISGIRFYKGAQNTGTHVGSLWSSGGALLGRATFAGESASGWQTVSFDGPVPIAAGTTYIASYHAPNGRYALTSGAFATAGTATAPVRALAGGEDGPNGVYSYGSAPAFPTETFGNANYWVDVTFSATQPVDATSPTVLSLTPASGASGVDVGTVVRVRFSEQMDAASVVASLSLRDAGGDPVSGSVAYDATTYAATLTPDAPLAIGGNYAILVRGGSAGAKDAAGNPLASDQSASFATKACPCNLWGNAVPTLASASGSDPVEVGLKFRSDVAGTILGVRFYRGAANGGPQVGSLWTETGALLARVTFPAASEVGWQEAHFAAPVGIEPGVTYVVSYFAPTGGYAVDLSYFGAADVVNPPLRALSGGVAGGNGVFRYGSSPAFPTETYGSSNYWVDVLFAVS